MKINLQLILASNFFVNTSQDTQSMIGFNVIININEKIKQCCNSCQ